MYLRKDSASLMGGSSHKNDNDSASNINIEGYEFVSMPTLTNAGGIGSVYITQGMQFHIRDDLCSTWFL